MARVVTTSPYEVQIYHRIQFLQYQRFVASFSFVIIIDDAEMIEKSLSIFFRFQIGYCNSNTVGTTTPNILISYLTYSKLKIWWTLNKEPSITPCRAQHHCQKITTMIRIPKQIWRHKIQIEFQGKVKHHHKTRVLTKAKALS